jgi:hypothetical protein
MRTIRRLTITLMGLVVTALLLSASASAFVGGGRKPSEAPPITYGQRYSAELNNHEVEANYSRDSESHTEVAIWKLPPLSTRDSLVVNWHVLPFVHESGSFPICMILAQGIDDFSWGSVFGNTTYSHSCYENGPVVYKVSGSGTAQTAITVAETSETSYLEFFANANQTDPTRLEPFPYDFSVEAPRHYLGVAFTPVSKVATNGFLHANVTRADGSPGPDGMTFTLTATWSGGGIATYTAASVGGGLSYALALPEAAAGKSVTFQISRGADNSYQAIESNKLTLSVSKPKPAVNAAACEGAKRHVTALARQYNRLSQHALRARRRSVRRSLRHRAHVVGNALVTARAGAKATCHPS